MNIWSYSLSCIWRKTKKQSNSGQKSVKLRTESTVRLQNSSGYWPTLIWFWLWHCNRLIITRNYIWSFFAGTKDDLIALCISNPPCAERKQELIFHLFYAVPSYILWPGQGCLNTHTQSIAAGRHDKGDKILSGSHPGSLIKSSSTLCHTEMWLI